jgi:hypothetical protein
LPALPPLIAEMTDSARMMPPLEWMYLSHLPHLSRLIDLPPHLVELTDSPRIMQPPELIYLSNLPHLPQLTDVCNFFCT